VARARELAAAFLQLSVTLGSLVIVEGGGGAVVKPASEGCIAFHEACHLSEGGASPA
jgi:hypothetical protein